jgi:hypothetical protein
MGGQPLDITLITSRAQRGIARGSSLTHALQTLRELGVNVHCCVASVKFNSPSEFGGDQGFDGKLLKSRRFVSKR